MNVDPPRFSSEELDLTVHGRHIAARRIRPAGLHARDLPVLVFLHEGLGSMQLWGDFPEALAGACGLPALLFDRLGHGFSDPLPSAAADIGYLDREAEAFFPQVMSACSVGRSILIGHSDGGTIALLYAAEANGGVLGVVTEAAHVFVDDRTRQGIRRAVSAYRHKDLKSRLAKHHGPKIDNLFWRWAGTWLSEEFAGWNIQNRLKGVRCPVLTIQGEADEYGTAAQMAAIAAGVEGPADTFLVPGCRHVPHRQAAEAVTERVVAFVSRLIS